MSSQTPSSTASASASASASPGDGRSSTDPSGFVTSPPSVIVKVVGTQRDDINGLLGVALSFNVDRQRYLVHMTQSQSTMAFKKENLAAAGFADKYRAQWQQFQNDPRVKEKLQHYVRTSQQYVAPLKLSHVVVGLAVLVVLMLFLFGVSKTIMVFSLLALLIVVAAPDLMAKKPVKIVAANFPARARQTIEKNVPFLRGKINDKVALAVVLLMIVVCGKTLLTPVRKASPKPVATGGTSRFDPSASSDAHEALLKKYYTLGFDDATAVKEHGSSLTEELISADLAGLASSARSLSDEYPDAASPGDYDFVTPPPPPPKSKGFFGGLMGKASGMTNIMSMMFLYRTIMSLGTEPQTGLFSMAQLAANFRGMPVWRQALMGLSVARLVSGFLF